MCGTLELEKTQLKQVTEMGQVQATNKHEKRKQNNLTYYNSSQINLSKRKLH